MTTTGEKSADVIVVGAGGAGAPLAARLSEDPARRVLVLEAGPAPRRREDFPAELLDASTVQGAMPGHPHNWAFPAHLADGVPYLVARGRILGGSTALNGAYFVRATPGDFARWAEVAGEEWSYDAVLPTMRRLERDREFGGDPRHGDAGPMPVVRDPLTATASAAFRAAARELGHPDEPDKNVPGPPGVGPVPSNLHDGLRWNTALAYLLPAVDRPNLEVRGDARVVRVVIESGRAVGVELAGGEILRAGEVVLAAGAIASPHLLLLSGIGPRADLERLGIPVHADLPVGAAFSDHPDIAVGWRPTRPIGGPGEGAAFPASLTLASPEHPEGDLEILLSRQPLGYLLTGELDATFERAQDLELIVALQRPESRGTIRLTSADPDVPPQIAYDHLATPNDRARMRAGLREAVRLLRSAAFAPLVAAPAGDLETALDNDERLDAWMLAHLGTAIHLCGSAPMGEAGSSAAVVDGHGRVHGVPGLRVADTSILPTAPSRGPAATAVLIGERVAGFIADGA